MEGWRDGGVPNDDVKGEFAYKKTTLKWHPLQHLKALNNNTRMEGSIERWKDGGIE